MKKEITLAALLAVAALPPLALAQSGHAGHQAGATAGAAAALSEGEIRKVDREAKKVTIKHGPLANLDMPPMTMVFRVKDPKLLDQVKAGDKVKFRAEKDGGDYVVTRIQK